MLVGGVGLIISWERLAKSHLTEVSTELKAAGSIYQFPGYFELTESTVTAAD